MFAKTRVGQRVLQARELIGGLFGRARLAQYRLDQQRRPGIQQVGLAGRVVIDDVLVTGGEPGQVPRRGCAIGGMLDGRRGQTSSTGCAETASELMAVADIRMPRLTLTPRQPRSDG